MKLEVKIKTLTPLWTGGVDAGKVDRIHETGILGSLRWWYEVLVRGLGGDACDPSQGKCGFNADKYAKSSAKDERQRLRDAGLCDVCQVFGAIGWRRRFRLTIVDNTKADASVSSRITANRSYTDNQGKERRPTWYFPNDNNAKPRFGDLTFQIQSLAPDFSPEIITGLVQFIADWVAIGARARMGFGVIGIVVSGGMDTQPLFDWLKPLVGSSTYADLPSLRNIFLARIAPQNGAQFTEIDTFNLKYDIRRLFANNKHLRHFIMGTVKGQRIAAKVSISRPYNDGQKMCVWGWIPEEANVYSNSWNRDAVVKAIHDHLEANYELKVWREMNSDRDTATPNSNNAVAWLRDLLAIEEEDDAA